MRRIAVLGAGAGVAAGLTLAGCGMSSGVRPQATPAATHLSAVRIERRAERAFARVHSVELVESTTYVGHRRTTMHVDVAPGGMQNVLQTPKLTITSRLVGSRIFVNATAAGTLQDALLAEGRSTGAGSWVSAPLPAGYAELKPLTQPATLVRCMLDPGIGRPRLAGDAEIDGVPANVLRIDEGDLGTTTLAVAAGPPYLPLQLVRTGQRSSALAHGLRVAAREGCQLSGAMSTVRSLTASLAHRQREPAPRSLRITFDKYDALDRIVAPRHAHAVSASAWPGG